MVRVDGATHLWSRADFLTTRECPPGAEALRPKTRAAVRLWALAAGWLSSKARTICYERAKASESPRVAKSACKMWFRLQSASNSPKTHVFGTMRSVSRRPITVAVFRRAVRHHRAPARRSTPSPTPAGCPTVAEASRPRIREWSPRPFTAASGPRSRFVRPARPSTVPTAAAGGWIAVESALERLQGLKIAHFHLKALAYGSLESLCAGSCFLVHVRDTGGSRAS